jgi:hypothetical protein
MTGNAPAIPDITLTLDTDGVIRTAVISDTLAEEGVESSGQSTPSKWT